jgi:hypothetical protein
MSDAEDVAFQAALDRLKSKFGCVADVDQENNEDD